MHSLTPKNVFHIQIFHDLNQQFERQGANNIIHVLDSNLRWLRRDSSLVYRENPTFKTLK